MARRRPARRWFGRPKDGPGPQDTFQSEFQLEPTQAPPVGGSHQTFRVAPHPPPAAQEGASVQRRISAPMPLRASGRRARDAAGTSRQGEQRPSMGAHNNLASSPSARAGRLEAEPAAAQAGPSRRPRQSAGHRPTRSNPTETTQAAGGTYTRSRSSSTLVRSDPCSPVGEPSSWPRGMHMPTGYHRPPPDHHLAVSPVSYPGYPGYGPQTPGSPGVGRGQYTPPTLSPSQFGAMSTGSLPLMSPHTFHHHRPGSYELPEPSPTDTSSWHYPSPAALTPSSMRGVSIPPSVQSDPSPYMDWAGQEFSPLIGPSDPAELPPLTPDMPVGDVFWDPVTAAQPHTVITAPGTHGHGPSPFGSRHYAQTSSSVPELFFPSELFGSSQDVFAFSDAHFGSSQDMSQSSTHTERAAGPSAPGYSAQAGRPPGY